MAYKMKGSSFYGRGNQSPNKKALVGNQANLPEHLKAKIDAAPGKMYDSPANKKETDQDELTRLVDKRTKLTGKEAKREAKRKEGGKVLFGNLKTKINKKKLAKTQSKINANPKAQENLADSNSLKEYPTAEMNKKYKDSFTKSKRKIKRTS